MMGERREDVLLGLAADVVARARARGADVAEVLASEGAELRAKVRLGETELLEEAGSRGLGLRVMRGGRSATTFTSDTTRRGLDRLVDDALELAALGEPDPFAEPPDPSLLATALPDLDLADPEVEALDAAAALELARRGEDAARGYDPRITNSDGATVSRGRQAIALVTSGGFSGAYGTTSLSLVVEPIADDADGKKRNGRHWDARRHRAALATPEAIGAEAARRTLAKLGARKVETAELPVVFDPDAGRALLSLLLSTVSGGAIYRRASWLVDREGEAVASPRVTVVDDPLLPRAPGSRPFDGEGLASRRNVVLQGGVLASFLLDTYSARKLGRASTGSAARGVGGRPVVAASNFLLLAGDRPAADLVREVDRGLYVTGTMGFGFNAVTGDFSRGAEGFLIERGELGHPVSEVTIGLGFDRLWRSIDAVGDDLDLRGKVATPSFRVARMTVAGR